MKIKVGSDFSGVGAFNQALKRLKIDYEEVFACDMDKFARKTFIHNYGEPKYYPTDVYEREIPKEPLDLYMTSPPCQAFSLAGSRKGEQDERGILFFNSLEFIRNNQPRFFIFENVKGLLSDNEGKTFQGWINLLGGKSVNGNPVMFPLAESVPYHIYYKVLNSKDYGVPQNRERIFIVGIKEDKDNNFRFPSEQKLDKKFKDMLEEGVEEKHFMSKKMEDFIYNYKPENFKISTPVLNETDIARTITTGVAFMRRQDNFILDKLTCKFNFNTCRNLYIEKPSVDLCRSCEEGCNYLSIDKRLIDVIEEEVEEKYFLSDKNIEYFKNNTEKQKKEGNGWKFEIKGKNSIANAITTKEGQRIYNTFIKQNGNIRKLTPRECFRLMDFPEDFDFSVVSDTQAYKQAGNSIVVAVLEKIINNLAL